MLARQKPRQSCHTRRRQNGILFVFELVPTLLTYNKRSIPGSMLAERDRYPTRQKIVTSLKLPKKKCATASELYRVWVRSVVTEFLQLYITRRHAYTGQSNGSAPSFWQSVSSTVNKSATSTACRRDCRSQHVSAMSIRDFSWQKRT